MRYSGELLVCDLMIVIDTNTPATHFVKVTWCNGASRCDVFSGIVVCAGELGAPGALYRGATTKRKWQGMAIANEPIMVVTFLCNPILPCAKSIFKPYLSH